MSTAPSLSLLSWSVDGTCHTHHRYRRRLSLEQRIPILCDTILTASPDLVALQDSVPEIAEALCGSSSSSSPSYDLIGAVRNGRCGFLQLFQRRDSLWRGRTLPHFPSLSAEFVHAADGAGAGDRFVLTNVDLTYRGKSLAIGGALLAPREVSAGGSPFTLTVPGSSPGPNSSPGSGSGSGSGPGSGSGSDSGSTRVKGQLDPHRDAALSFIARVARPDVMVGNFFMGRAESMPGYDDAWVRAGAPADHERTSNTFVHHKHDAETNGYYFLPLAAAAGDSSVLGETEIAAGAPLGTSIPLHAVSRGLGSGWDIALTLSNPPVNNNNDDKDGNNDSNSKNKCCGAVATPEGAGRYQRCLFRRKPSRHQRSELSFYRRFERTQFVLLRPFVEVKRTAEELAVGGDGRATCEEERSVRCSASDQYPVLVLLS